MITGAVIGLGFSMMLVGGLCAIPETEYEYPSRQQRITAVVLFTTGAMLTGGGLGYTS